jgi:hypothetical protein
MTAVDAHPVSEDVPLMSRLIRSCALAALSALLVVPAAAPAAAAGGPVAQAAKGCSLKLSEQRNLGTTYVFSLSASGGATCSGAKSLAKAYHACRHRKGAGGKCGSVSGYSCSERRYNKSRFSYDATATCAKGGKKVVQKYQQNI